MNKRIVPIAGAVVVVVALVALALVAGRGDGDEPRVLPVLSASTEGAATRSGDVAVDDSELGVAGYNEYVLPDELPELPDEAPAYELTDEVGEDDVLALAERLGMTGEVEDAEWGWSLHDGDRTLDVGSAPGSSWSYYSSAEVEGVEPHLEEEPVADDRVVAEEEEVVAPTASIDRDRAERRGRQVLADLGVDTDAAEVRVEDGWTSWIVTADPEVDGHPTFGFATSVSIGADDRVEFASGSLAVAERIADYPLDGVQPVVDRANALEREWAEGASGDRPAERWTIEVQRVRLGLAMSSTNVEGAPAFLVPSYLLLTEDGWESSFFAVTDELLTLAPVEEDGEGDDHGDEHEAPHGTAAETCTGQGSAAAPGEVPEVEELQVCAVTATSAGEPVQVTVSAVGRVRDDCASPVVTWGDGGGTAVCEIGCAALPEQPVQLERTFEHTYDEPGTYRVDVVLAGCPGGEQARATVEIVVEG